MPKFNNIVYTKSSCSGYIETEFGFVHFSEGYSDVGMNVELRTRSGKVTDRIYLDYEQIEAIITAAMICGVIDKESIKEIKKRVKESEREYSS